METARYNWVSAASGIRNGLLDGTSRNRSHSKSREPGVEHREYPSAEFRIPVEYLEYVGQNGAGKAKKRICSTVGDREDIIQVADAFRRGEVWAFRRVAEEFFPPITNFLIHLTRDVDVAQDLAQEAFFAAFRSHHTLREGAPLAPWIFKIARNLAYKEFNRRGKEWKTLAEEGIEGTGCEPRSNGPSPHETAIDRDLRERIDRALAKVKPKFRDAVILRLVQGYSSEEAASLLGVPVATLNTRVHRGLRQLRRSLKFVGITEKVLLG